MLTKNIEKLVKQTNTIEVIYTTDCVWISNALVSVPLFNFSDLTEEQCCALFNVPEEKRNRFTLSRRAALPDEKDLFRDAYDGEEELVFAGVMIRFGGEDVFPLFFSGGVVFAAREELEPFLREDKQTVFYARRQEGAYAPAVAAKSGMFIKGIIKPADWLIRDPELANRLREILKRADRVREYGYDG